MIVKSTKRYVNSETNVLFNDFPICCIGQPGAPKRVTMDCRDGTTKEAIVIEVTGCKCNECIAFQSTDLGI